MLRNYFNLSFLALSLSIFMMLSLASCGGNNNSDKENNQVTTNEDNNDNKKENKRKRKGKNQYEKPADLPNYSAPQSQMEIDKNWKMTDHKLWRYQKPGDKYTPRALFAETGPKYNVSSIKGAFESLKTEIDTDFKENPNFEKLEAWEKFDGSNAQIALIPTNYAGTDGVMFIYISNKKGSDLYGIVAIEATESTFRDWGGIAQMLVMRDVIPNLDVFPKERRELMAGAPLNKQVPFYEASLDALQKNLNAQAQAMSQSQVLLRMQELNYDLLLGDDITSPFIAD